MLVREVDGIGIAHGSIGGHARPHLLTLSVDTGEATVVIRWEQFETREQLEQRMQELEQAIRAGRHAVYYESPRMAHLAEVLSDAGDMVKVRVLDASGDRARTFWCSKLWLKRWSERPEWWHQLYAEGERQIEKMIVPALVSGHQQLSSR